MLVHLRVLAALLGAGATDLSTGLELGRQEVGLFVVGEGGDHSSRRTAYLCAREVEADAVAQVIDLRLFETRVGSGIAGAGTLITRVHASLAGGQCGSCAAGVRGVFGGLGDAHGALLGSSWREQAASRKPLRKPCARAGSSSARDMTLPDAC